MYKEEESQVYSRCVCEYMVARWGLFDYRPSLDPTFVTDVSSLAPSQTISCLAGASFLIGGVRMTFEPTFRMIREGYGSKIDERAYFR